jgi:hypothetical protein
VNNERRAELEALLSKSTSLIADFYSKVPEPEGEIEDLLADSRAEAAARFDQSLYGLRNFQYIVRIRRDDGMDDLIDGPSVRDVMGGIEAEVAAASQGSNEEARIVLQDLTRGSVVLHYKAVQPLITVEPNQFDHGLSIVDSAIAQVTALHAAIESRKPVAQIVKIAGSKGLLKESKSLLEHLQKHDLNLTTRWRDASGRRIASQLTKSAKDHAASIFEKETKNKNIYVFGQVISTSWDGKFAIKEKKKYEVAGSEQTIDLIRKGEIRLGERLHVVLEEDVAQDRAGLASAPTYKFIAMDDRLVP